jgi:hypothetical protein
MVLAAFRKHGNLAEESAAAKKAAREEAEKRRRERIAREKAKEEAMTADVSKPAEIEELTDEQAAKLEAELNKVT